MFNVKRISILASLLLIIGITGALFSYQSFAESDPVQEEHRFDEEITDIVVESDNARIEILPSADATTQVIFEMDTTKRSRYNLDAKVENGKLEVKAKEKMLQFFSFGFDWKPFITKVYLPEQAYDSIMAKTVNGAMTIEDFTVETLDAKSTNGSINIHNLDAETIKTVVENGQINFVAVTGALQAKTTNGRIELNTTTINDPIDFETVNGGIRVQVSENLENTEIRAETVNGSTSIFGETMSQSIIGDGENKMNLKTINGKIVVEN